MKRKLICLVIFILLATGIFIYISPNRSLKFTVLLYGFPKEAFNSEIIYSSKDDNNSKYYQLEPTTVGNTGPMILWKVKQVGPFYFSRYYGSH